MMKSGALIDSRDNNGDTALIKSGRKALENPTGFCFSSVISLLDCGSDPNIENNFGQSLRKLAEKNRYINSIMEEAKSHEK